MRSGCWGIIVWWGVGVGVGGGIVVWWGVGVAPGCDSITTTIPHVAKLFGCAC